MKVHPAIFQDLVAQAVDELPDWVGEQMDNIAIVVAPWPTPHQQRAANREQGKVLLGLYEGVPLTHRGRGYHLIPPDRITLFQGPLERIATDSQALVRLIRRTVVHEIAHHFGFSEEQIRELGY